MATVADVARLAGVSVSTVSYALTGNRPISAATRSRIERAMQKLGYTPNPFARGLKGKSGKIIALSCPIGGAGVPGLTMVEYVMSASQRAQERGYHLLLWTTPIDTVEELAGLARQGLVDGVVVMEVQMRDRRIEVLSQADLPFVLIGRSADPISVDFIDADFDQCARLAVDHLAGLGHAHLGVVTDPRVNAQRGRGASRRVVAGLRVAASRAGVRVTVVHCGFSTDAGRRAYRALLDSDPEITGVIVPNNEAISGVMAAAIESGRRIPDQLSVLGLVMTSAQAELTIPAVTAVTPRVSDMGRSAVDQLIDRVEGASGDRHQALFPGELELRATTGPTQRPSPSPARSA